MDNGHANQFFSDESYNSIDPDGILQVRLNGVTTFIGTVGLTVAFSVLVVLLTR